MIKNYIGLSVIFIIMFVPVYLYSDPTYEHYRTDEAAVKIAFKLSGERREECDKEALKKKYLEDAKAKGIRIKHKNFQPSCPRGRHPVRVELSIDGKELLKGEYKPGGLSEDLASFVYEHIIVKPGTFDLSVKVYDRPPGNPPRYVLEKKMELKSRQARVVWMDNKNLSLALD